MNTRKNEFAVSMEMQQFDGCRLARKYNISVSECEVGYGWVRRFMAWHDLTIRPRTTMAEYRKHTRNSWYVSRNKPRCWGNSMKACQTKRWMLTGPRYSLMLESTTVNSAGERTVQTADGSCHSQWTQSASLCGV
jgi:hypothetical protein